MSFSFRGYFASLWGGVTGFLMLAVGLWVWLVWMVLPVEAMSVSGVGLEGSGFDVADSTSFVDEDRTGSVSAGGGGG